MKISQREARLLKKRVAELEGVLDRQRNAWASEFPRGVNIRTIETDIVTHMVVMTARKLGHAVVVTTGSDRQLLLHALKLKGQE